MKNYLLVAFAALLSACTAQIATSPSPFTPNATLSGSGGAIMQGKEKIGEATVTQIRGRALWGVTVETEAQILIVSADGMPVKATQNGTKHTFVATKKVKRIGVYYQ